LIILNTKDLGVHPQIDNPDYHDDPELYAFPSFKHLGIDVWQVKSGTIFGHFLLTDDWDTAKSQIDAINTQRDAQKKKKEEEAAAAKPVEPEHDHEHDHGHDHEEGDEDKQDL